MINQFYFWLILALLWLLFEMGSPGLLFFLSFSIGALLTAFSTLLFVTVMQQCIIFLISTIITLYFVHYLLKRIVHKNAAQKTNVYALQGKQAFVVKKITPQEIGAIKIGGEIWAAQSLHDEIIDIGRSVKIVQIRGVRAIVEKSS